MENSPDSEIILLLCSRLVLEDDSIKPMNVREWNSLAHKLQAESLRPADILEASNLQKIHLDKEEFNRIGLLLSRRDRIRFELERLSRLGIFYLCRLDEGYPSQYRMRLKDAAPPVLFYAGDRVLLGQPGIAVVGSRHLDDNGMECARFVGNACGISGQVLYSGGAKGVDSISMEAALEARGTAVGILADSLERAVRSNQAALVRGDLCLVTPYQPNAGFSVGAAMGRNRLIYTLADFAIIVASDAESGGTWAGAVETLKNRWIPIFALEHENMPEGNKLLIQKGALSFPHPFTESPLKLVEWMRERAPAKPLLPGQPSLF